MEGSRFVNRIGVRSSSSGGSAKRAGRAWVAGAAAAAILAAAGPASALQPLQDFLSSARSKGLENKEANAATAQREAEADQAWGRVLPAITARGTYTHNDPEVAICQKPTGCTDAEKIVITKGDQLDSSVSLEVPLVDVAGWSRVAAARSTAKAAALRAQATAQDTDRALAQRYFQAIAAHALLDAANRAVLAAEAAQKVAVLREGAGTTSSLETDRAAAEVARSTQSVADAELLRVVSRRALESTSGLKPSDGAPALADDLKDEAALDTWEKDAKDTPAVRAAQLEKEAAESSATAAWAALLPTVSATATERATNATGFSGKIFSSAIGLTATWRLDLVGIRGVAAQGAATEASAIRKERAERDAKDKVFEAYQQVVAQIAKSKAARAQVKAAAHAAEVAQDRYAQGAGTQLDVIQADRDAFQAEVARIQADADLAFARVSLRLAAGRPLDGVKAAAGGSGAAADSPKEVEAPKEKADGALASLDSKGGASAAPGAGAVASTGAKAPPVNDGAPAQASAAPQNSPPPAATTNEKKQDAKGGTP